MTQFVLMILFAALTLLAVALQKTYHHIPNKELKRRAREGDEIAAMLYKAVSYGGTLDFLLWLIIGLSAAALFVVINSMLDGIVAVLACAGVIWLGFVWVPASRVTEFGRRLTAYVTPVIAWLLKQLYPVYSYVSKRLSRLRPISIHTGLYQKEDILDLINQQKIQADSRITEEELRIVTHTLTYGDKLIRSYMTPRRVVKMVAAEDTIGPVLMTELHASGHSRFPVYSTNKDTIVGTLFMRDLVTAKSGGKVSEVMHKSAIFVNEEASLDHALQAFLRTKHHLFIVVNEFEEIVGIITIEDVLEQILGKKILDEFDQFEDLRAVARLHAEADRKKNIGEHIEEMVESKMID